MEFYKDGFYTYESERDDIVHQITRYVIGRERKGEFLTLIDQMSSDPENEGMADKLIKERFVTIIMLKTLRFQDY